MFGDGYKMPYATRKMCPFPGCDHGEKDGDGNATAYITPEGIATRAEVSEELKEHVHMAHELILKHKEVEVTKINAEAAKIQGEAARQAAAHPPVPGQEPSVVHTEGRVAKEKRAVIPRP